MKAFSETASKNGRRAARWLKQVRIWIGILLVALLLYLVDLRQTWAALCQVRLIYVLYMVLITVTLIWLSCVKWRLFIRAAGHDVPLRRLMSYYTMSYFFNMFFPSMLGGDVARSLQVGQEVKSHKSAFAATFVERVTGFLAMTWLGVIFVAAGAKVTSGLEFVILAVALAATFGTLVCFSRPLAAFFFAFSVRLCRGVKLNALAGKLEWLFAEVVEAISFIHDDFWLFARAIFFSVLFHFGAVVNTYICALAVGWHQAPLGGLCIVVPLVLLVAIVPITPSSLGIQDGAFVFLLERIGALPAQGLGISIILRAKNMVTAGIGGLLWLLHKAPAGAMEATRPEA